MSSMNAAGEFAKLGQLGQGGHAKKAITLEQRANFGVAGTGNGAFMGVGLAANTAMSVAPQAIAGLRAATQMSAVLPNRPAIPSGGLKFSGAVGHRLADAAASVVKHAISAVLPKVIKKAVAG